MWAAMVSASRPGSSMPASDDRISGGTFLLSLTYWSNRLITERASTSVSRSSSLPVSSTGAMRAEKKPLS